MIEELFAEALTRFEWVLIVLTIIIIAGPIIIERFRLPGMIGLVLGGLLVGPYGLGLLSEGSLDILGGIGLLFLMFLAGAELDLNLFQRYRSAAIGFGLLTFTFPFVFSLLGATWIGLSISGAILMGAVWASHTLVSYPEVRHAGLSSNKAVAVTIGATVITDTLALVVLAVISALGSSSGSEASTNPVVIVISLVLGLGLLAFYCLWCLPRLAHWFFQGPGRSDIMRFLFVLAAMASAGFLATAVGIEGLVGAFFAGLGLNRYIPNGGHLMERTEFFSSALFIPAFLVSVGMLINPLVLFNLQTLMIAAVFLLTLAAGKVLAAWIGGRRYGFTTGEIGLMFSLTIAQAAATLASTLVGFSIGLFGEQIVNAVLLVVMITLLVSSISTVKFSQRIEPQDLILKPLGGSVIVMVQPSEALNQLMTLAAGIAFSDGGIVVPVAVIPEHSIEKLRSETKEWLEKAEKFGAAAAADVQSALRIDTSDYKGVLHELTEREGSLILLEWQGQPGVANYLFGGLVDYIGTHSPVPVAASYFSGDPITRLVLAPGFDQGNTGYHVDLQIAIQIAGHLQNSQNLPLMILTPPDAAMDELAFLDRAETIKIEPGLEAVEALLLPGDLVIVPASTMRRVIGSYAIALSSLSVNILMAAGPYRLSMTSAKTTHEAEAIFSFGN